MRKLVYYVAVSIDGYIAGPADEVDFYPIGDDMAAWINERYPETIPTHLRAQVGVAGPNQRFDTLLMGRGTYQPALDVGVSSPYRHLRQYVVSTTIPEINDPTVELISGDPIGPVRRLKEEQSDLDIWLCGGGKLAGSLLPEIDELIVKRYPVVAGSGVAVFSAAFRPTLFEPARTEHFRNGADVTWYSRA